jgi:hypothetical protein
MKPLNFFFHVSCLCVALYGNAAVYGDYCVLSQSPVVTLYFGVETLPPDPNTAQRIPAAHTDIEIPLRFSGWDVHLKTDRPAANTRIEIEQAFFALGPEHRFAFQGAVPPAFAFIGAAPGETFWYYDQERPPAPGFDSQDMTAAERNALCLWDPNDPTRNANAPGRWLRVHLVEVRGPEDGHIAMWQEAGASPRVFFSTFDGGITESDVFYIPAGQHAHNSWAFTRPGLYEVALQISTSIRCDAALTADINSDCKVDVGDFARLAGYWLREDCALAPNCGQADITDSGQVDINDLLEMAMQWLLCGSPFESECL